MAAPKTVLTYPLNGALKDFAIPFEYLARKFVVVTLVGATRRVLTLNSEYRFTTKQQVTTTTAWGPAQGFDLIEVRRVTSATERLVDFSDGSILRAYDLNTAQVQSLHIAEEARDLTADTIGVNNNGDLDARGRRIVNLADPVDPGDACNLRVNQQWTGSALNQATASAASATASEAARVLAASYRDSAQAAAVEAEAARVLAASYRDSASAYATTSASQAAIATTQASNSATSASASQTSRSAAEAARDLSLSYRNAASASASAAAASAAGVNLPSATGNSLKMLRQNISETGLEYIPSFLTYGIGAPTAPVNVDSTTLQSGVYQAASSVGGGTYPSGFLNGSLIVSSRNVSPYRAHQILTSDGGGGMWARGNDGTFGAWNLILQQKNIFGTVSQTSGVPTGAIVEYSTGTNGDCIRWADGTQICTFKGIVAVEFTTVVAAFYTHSGDFTVAKPFAKPFAGTPKVTHSYQQSGWYGFSQITTLPTSANWPGIKGFSMASATGTTVTYDMIAYGRWY